MKAEIVFILGLNSWLFGINNHWSGGKQSSFSSCQKLLDSSCRCACGLNMLLHGLQVLLCVL